MADARCELPLMALCSLTERGRVLLEAVVAQAVPA
jgi:hypothetical protein